MRCGCPSRRARPPCSSGACAAPWTTRTGSARAVWARAAALVQALVRPLPRSWALALGRALGRLLADLDPRHVAIAAENLRQAFPHWDEARRLRTARAVYAHFGQTLVDILWMADQRRERLLSLIVEE